MRCFKLVLDQMRAAIDAIRSNVAHAGVKHKMNRFLFKSKEIMIGIAIASASSPDSGLNAVATRKALARPAMPRLCGA